jgi:hypothetical protein
MPTVLRNARIRFATMPRSAVMIAAAASTPNLLTPPIM